MENCFVAKYKDSIFTPHQPYLEFNTTYKSYKPSQADDMYGVVWEMYQVDGFDSSKTIALPDHCADIMVFYMRNEARIYFMSSTIGVRSMLDFDFLPEVHTIFGVKLCTGIIGNIFKGNFKDIGSGSVECIDILGREKELLIRLECAKTFEERGSIVRDYLYRRLSHTYDLNMVANYISKEIVDNRGKIGIKELESKMGYSGRYLRKIANDYIGVSVKQLCEVVQFQWSYHLFKEADGRISFSDLACQGGYYDQSHFNNSCKKLTGELPKKIMNLYML